MGREPAGGVGTPGRTLVLADVEVDGSRVDVRIEAGTIAEVGRALATRGVDEVVDGGGGALLPGLHDHHVHLLALAAAERSVPVGPPEVTDRAGFAAALRAADAALAPGTWLRAVGYHESVAGPLDRADLDAVVPSRPVRVQHRTGVRWILSTAALDAVGPLPGGPGVALGPDGRPTGVLDGLDHWLRDRLPVEDPGEALARVGRRLSAWGVTGVTDATPCAALSDLAPLAAACRTGALPQRVVAMGGHPLAGAAFPAPLERGPVKLVVGDHDLPDLDDLASWIAAAHGHGRPVAVHLVTRVALVLALTAWEVAGSRPGDRIEHGSVIPPELLAPIAAMGLTVVTQPGFVAARGDRYLVDVDPEDRPHLYPCASLLAAGIPVGGSTDAPFGPADPWVGVRAAVRRRTDAGVPLGPAEAVTPRRALELLLTDPFDPGGAPRRIVPGAPAELCLLGVPLAAALRSPSADVVVRTLHGTRPGAS